MAIELIKEDKLEASQTLRFFANGSERLTIYNNGISTFRNSINLIVPASNPTLTIQADTNTSPAPAIRLMRGTNDTWGADNYTDWEIKDSYHLLFSDGTSGTTTERLKIWADGTGLTINNAYKLPGADGSNGQVLTTNGSGAVSWAAGGGGTDSFLIFGEESDEYLNEGGAGNAHGFFAAYGNGVHNTTKSSSGADFGLPLGCDCTLKAIRVHCGNKNSDTNSGTITFDIYKNNSAESDTFTGNASGSSGNSFIISKTDYDIDFSAGDTFNIKVTTPTSSSYTAQVGPTRMTAYFERQ